MDLTQDLLVRSPVRCHYTTESKGLNAQNFRYMKLNHISVSIQLSPFLYTKATETLASPNTNMIESQKFFGL